MVTQFPQVWRLKENIIDGVVHVKDVVVKVKVEKLKFELPKIQNL